MSHKFCKRRCRSLPLRILHTLECFSRANKRHRGQETMVTVFLSLKWGHCTWYPMKLSFLFFVCTQSHFFSCSFCKISKRRPLLRLKFNVHRPSWLKLGFEPLMLFRARECKIAISLIKCPDSLHSNFKFDWNRTWMFQLLEFCDTISYCDLIFYSEFRMIKGCFINFNRECPTLSSALSKSTRRQVSYAFVDIVQTNTYTSMSVDPSQKRLHPVNDVMVERAYL